MHPSRNERNNQYCFRVLNLEQYPIRWSSKACSIAATIDTAEAKHKIFQVLFHLPACWIKGFYQGVLVCCSIAKTNVPVRVNHLTLSSGNKLYLSDWSRTSNMKYSRGEVLVPSHLEVHSDPAPWAVSAAWMDCPHPAPECHRQEATHVVHARCDSLKSHCCWWSSGLVGLFPCSKGIYMAGCCCEMTWTPGVPGSLWEPWHRLESTVCCRWWGELPYGLVIDHFSYCLKKALLSDSLTAQSTCTNTGCCMRCGTGIV